MTASAPNSASAASQPGPRWRSIQFGRLPLSELVFYYAAKPVDIADRLLLIRINRLYRHDMSPVELYDATRGTWKLGPRRAGATCALAVFESVVREVYQIEEWHAAGTTEYVSRAVEQITVPGRWEFTGRVAPQDIRQRYVGGSVAAYFKKGLQSPFVYVNG